MMHLPLQRLAYVDDEPHLRLLAQACLTKVGGFEAAVYASGRELLAEGPAFAPQLILLDVMMPDLDGPGTLKLLRDTPGLAEVPVIFVTAKTRPAEVQHYRNLGALDVLAKPFKPMTFPDDLRACWQRHGAAGADGSSGRSGTPSLV